MQFQSIRGMKDILPSETPQWQWVEATLRTIMRRYSYQEIRLPILEPIELFQRAVGAATDIVAKEMYDFTDKSGEHITLRPEGTSGCVRSIIENDLCYHTTQRLWYQGPMFRYERPQKGRLRQFNQFGVETFGMAGPEIDSELILLSHDIFTALGIAQHVRLEINSLGTPEERAEHRAALVSYFEQHRELLDDDSLIRLDKNPLRILDSKNPDMQGMLEDAPQLLDYLSAESRQHFQSVCATLERAGIAYTINPRLVRGLDYYTRTVFEWITDKLGAQSTVCGGGRYDGLVNLFCSYQLPASGFAIGIERLLLLLDTLALQAPAPTHPKICFTSEDPALLSQMLLLGHQLHTLLPDCELRHDYSATKLKKQHQRAIKEHANIILTLNDATSLSIWVLASNQKATISPHELHHLLAYLG
ncbi:Histidine--tRNA ligase [Plesiomonas shigelloides]|uniref:histidine--tRNA ligase n=1 Tax=Plesiomonas shigelloides TaxID=703 RepID=UPI000D904627|nr:histidine--tRNA ligase [Plesiomonas shigelloides]SPZ37578.1 Histidine--tRNA ligase [Plesiomonas shigelloides]